jgi:hypothetical protein
LREIPYDLFDTTLYMPTQFRCRPVAIAGAPSHGVNLYLNTVAPNTTRIFEASQGWVLQTWLGYANMAGLCKHG